MNTQLRNINYNGNACKLTIPSVKQMHNETCNQYINKILRITNSILHNKKTINIYQIFVHNSIMVG